MALWHVFGFLGYLIPKFGLEVAPLVIRVIRFILAQQAEMYFVKSLESFGTPANFFTTSPIAVLLWFLIALCIGFSIDQAVRSHAKTAGS